MSLSRQFNMKSPPKARTFLKIFARFMYPLPNAALAFE